MRSADSYNRSIVYPKAISDGILDFEQFFQLDQIEKSGIYAFSISSQAALASLDEAHESGALIAEAQNARFLARKGHLPDPLKTYVGFYELSCCAICQIDMSYYRIELLWRPAEGASHYHVEVTPLAVEATNSQRRNDRTIAARKLSQRAIGPTLCKVETDSQDILDFLEALPATTATFTPPSASSFRLPDVSAPSARDGVPAADNSSV